MPIRNLILHHQGRAGLGQVWCCSTAAQAGQAWLCHLARPQPLQGEAATSGRTKGELLCSTAGHRSGLPLAWLPGSYWSLPWAGGWRQKVVVLACLRCAGLLPAASWPCCAPVAASELTAHHPRATCRGAGAAAGGGLGHRAHLQRQQVVHLGGRPPPPPPPPPPTHTHPHTNTPHHHHVPSEPCRHPACSSSAASWRRFLRLAGRHVCGYCPTVLCLPLGPLTPSTAGDLPHGARRPGAGLPAGDIALWAGAAALRVRCGLRSRPWSLLVSPPGEPAGTLRPLMSGGGVRLHCAALVTAGRPAMC